MHPEPNGHGSRHLPEPAIGPETGIAARLSESLRLTNGFKDRAVDLLPRLSLCFLAEDRASAQRLAVAYPHLYFLMPDGVCYHGHTVTGGKKSGAGPLAMKREARELAARAARSARTALDRAGGAPGRLEPGDRRRWKPSWSGCARCSRRARRTAWRWITKCASWATIWRAPIRGFRWRAWNWSGCAAMPKNPPSSASGIAPPSRRKSDCAPSAKQALEAERQELEKLEGQAAAIGEEHAATRAELAGLEERHRGERAGHGAGSNSSSARPSARRNAIAPEIERLGEQRVAPAGQQYRAGSDGRATGRRDHRPGSRASTRWRSQDAAMREALRAGEEELKTLRAGVRRVPREAFADRSRAGAQAGRAEVSWTRPAARNSNCPVEELAAADDPVPDAEAIARSRAGLPTKCATASNRSAR